MEKGRGIQECRGVREGEGERESEGANGICMYIRWIYLCVVFFSQ